MAFSNDIKRRIIADNLRTQDRVVTATLESRRSHLSDLAAVLLSSYSGQSLTAAEIRTMGADAFLTAGEIGFHREMRMEIGEKISASMTNMLAYDRATLSVLIGTHCSRDGAPLTMAAFLPAVIPPARVAYVRNAYADEAFDAFSAISEMTTSLFTDGYEDACLAVAEGEAGYCILPWRDTIGAYHRATLALMDAYELTAVSTVMVTDGEDVPMQYALLARDALSVRGRWEMLLALPKEWLVRMAELTATLPHLDVTLTGITADAHTGAVLCTLRGEMPPVSLFTWLCLFAPQYKLRGFYPYVEEIE